jgi:hypothetical protein
MYTYIQYAWLAATVPSVRNDPCKLTGCVAWREAGVSAREASSAVCVVECEVHQKGCCCCCLLLNVDEFTGEAAKCTFGIVLSRRVISQ